MRGAVQIKQVCEQLPTYADKVTLPAFACRCNQAPAAQQLIDVSCLLGPQQQTCNS